MNIEVYQEEYTDGTYNSGSNNGWTVLAHPIKMGPFDTKEHAVTMALELAKLYPSELDTVVVID